MATKSFTMLTLIIALLLNGCSYLKFPGVHKIDIQQGNIITQDMVDQLQPGMSKSQVRFVMGTPLIADTFNQSRWDYFYSLRAASGDESRERISIFFDQNDQLSHFVGDFIPSNATQQDSAESEPS